jgi:hypothetical protein
MAAASVTCQVWHSSHSGTIWLFALIEGLAPIICSFGLTHAGGMLGRVHWWVYIPLFIVVGLAMYLSANAIHQVVERGEGNVAGWVFGFTLDGASLAALGLILYVKQQEAAHKESAAEIARAEASALTKLAIANETIAGLNDQAAGLQAEVGRLTAALAKGGSQGRNRKPAAGRKPGTVAARKRPAGSAAKTSAQTGSSRIGDELEEGFTALDHYLRDPDITGPQMGEKMGVGARRGRQLVAECKARVTAGHGAASEASG